MVNHNTVIRIFMKNIDSVEDSLILFTARPFAGAAELSSENDSAVMSFMISPVVQI